MGGVFGLGILLTLTDKVSSPLGSINSSLKKTQNEAEATQKALNNIKLDAKANTSFSGGKFTDTISGMKQCYTYYDRYGRLRRRWGGQLERMAMKDMGGIEGVAKSLEHSIKPFGKIGGVTVQGKEAARVMADFADKTMIARRALVGFDSTGSKKIDAKQRTEALKSYYNYVNNTQAKLKDMFNKGEIDAVGYSQAIKQMGTQYKQFNRIQEKGFRTTSQYLSQLQQAGISTNAQQDMMAINMERQRGALRAQADTILSMKPSAMKLSQVWDKVGNSMRGASTYTLEIASSLQNMAKNQNPQVMMLKMAEAGMSMKDANDYIMATQNLVSGLVTIFPALAGGALAFYTTLGGLAASVCPQVGSAFNNLKSNLLTTFDPLLQSIGKVEVKAINFANGLVTSFANLQKTSPIVADSMQTFALAIPGAAVLGAAIPLLQHWGFTLQEIIMNVTQAGGSMMGVAEAISVVVGNAVALATTVTIFKELYQNCDGFRNAVDGLRDSIKGMVSNFREAHPTAAMFLIT